MVRFKNRYLLFEILYQNEKQGKALSALQPVVLNLSTQELQRLIRDNIAENFGDYGVGSVGTHLQVKYFNPLTGLGIVRAPRDHFRIVWAALTFVTEIEKQPCIIRVIHTSGTIRSAQTHAIQYDRDQLLRLAQQEMRQVDTSNVADLVAASKHNLLALDP